MADKGSFILYTDYAEHLELLEDDERGRLFMALFEYAKTGAAPSLTGAEKIAFSFIRAQMDRDTEKWEEARQQKSESGRKGGIESGKRRKQTQANEALASSALKNEEKAKQAQANEAVTVTVPVTVPVTETPIPPTPFVGETPDGVDSSVVAVARAWDKISGKVTTMHDSESLMELLDEYGERRVLEAIRIAGDNGKNTIAYLKGIFRNEGKPPQSRGQPAKKPAERTADTWLNHHNELSKEDSTW